LGSVERCTNHTFELADQLCGDCGRPFCSLCIVTPFRRRAPLCHQCAVAAAGIRTSARTAPVRSRKEIKAFERERRAAEARAAPVAPTPGGFGPATPALTSSPSHPVTRGDATNRPPASTDDQADGDEEPEEKRVATPRNRPLWGLAR
jgi:hypothetical protein